MPETAKLKNRLLAALSKKAYQNLLPKFERVDLIFTETIYNPGDVISHVYFPESGIISLLTTIDGNSTLEVGMVGNEGMVGLPVFLGVKTSNNRAIVQGAGFALKMKTADFLAECRLGDELSRIIRLFTYSLIIQISQTAACNRFHGIESRLARWLLMTHDRMKTDKFRITQEFLSDMLGVRREAVNKVARSFRQRRLINYSRGNFSILNRKAMEVLACSCYKSVSLGQPSTLAS